MKKAVSKKDVKKVVKASDKKDMKQDKKMMGNGVLKKAKDCKY